MGGGGKGSKKVTVGYRYSWDVQAGLGRGPINEIVSIMADKKTVFAGTPGQISSSTSVYIDKPGLFGGDDTGGEGGIQGQLDIMMGEPDQVPPASLLKLLTGVVPGFRGVVTTFFSGLVSCYSASPKPWLYRVRRTTKGWDGDVWYPEKATILLENTESQIDDEADLLPGQIANLRAIHAMNPAHILVECATNRDWGRQLSLADDLNLDSYRAAADTLFNEGFGLCFRYNRQDGLDTFVQQILDHVGAVQYADLETGKLTLKLLRGDYNVDDLPLFTYDNGIIAVQDDDSASTTSNPNEIVVTWNDPVTNSDGEVRAQNLGAIQNTGLNSSSVEYKAIPTHSLAARVAQRDLETAQSQLTRLVIQFDRRGGILRPGDVFRVQLPDRNINKMVLRVGKIEEGDTGVLTLTVVQDVFGLPSTSYSSGQQGSSWTPPDKTARPVAIQRVIDLPYAVLAGTLSSADLSYLKPESGHIGVMAVAPTALSINYQLQTRAAGAQFADRGQGDWTPSGTLTAPVGRLDTILHVNLDISPAVGDGLIVGDEVMRIDGVDISAGTVTVGRGCMDSLPSGHLAGDRCWAYRDALESDGVEYLSGETAEVRLLTRTSTETLTESAATVMALAIAGRQGRPYLPGNIRLNSVLYPDTVASADTWTLAFSHRDRVLQADRLIDCTEGSIGPEPGVEYVVKLLAQDSGDTVWSLTTSLASIPVPYVTGGSGAAVHTLSLQSIRDGLLSLNTFEVALPAGRYKPFPIVVTMSLTIIAGASWAEGTPETTATGAVPELHTIADATGVTTWYPPDLLASGLSIPADDIDYPAGSWPASPFSFGTYQVLAIAQWTETTGPLTVLALEGDATTLLLDSATGAAAAIEWDAGIYLAEMDITIFTTDGPVLNEGIISLKLTERSIGP
ncbi:TPA: phage tail protein [Klebsiella pneumoniae]|uniref:phage tail protein n=1 Tax=Klebsiella pneumoniae complex TaxID=3390273 RepID=UPI001CDAFD98|nr:MULTISPECIES: phage tail protein [Klebsiella]EIX9611406.1 phage tail protein [Klebsiella pneumoniae]EJC6298679.1 phage tail protein [Klebsiella pneumoniae]MDT9854060.1 phage tail protein [Klebsiella pneumoniae]MDU6128420.1 phage tail protein [Klebsiella pneumoniae]MDU7856241.1 phage tail protein [Klebsiella pneumoniae]